MLLGLATTHEDCENNRSLTMTKEWWSFMTIRPRLCVRHGGTEIWPLIILIGFDCRISAQSLAEIAQHLTVYSCRMDITLMRAILR